MKKIIYWIGAVLLLVSCKGNGTQGTGLTSSSGRSSEMLVVCPASDWNGVLGDSLRSVLLASVPALPQSEPMFRVTWISPSSFNAVYQKFRNILVLQADASVERPHLGVSRNKWAAPQLIITMRAPSSEMLATAFSKQQEKVVDLIMRSEMSRFQRAQKAQQDNHIVRQLEEKYHISMGIPEGFVFAVKEDGFCWLRKDTKYWGQHLMLYSAPYTDAGQFSTEHIRQLRDRYTRKYVMGTTDSSYILTDDRFYPLESRLFDFPNSPYAVEVRGLWGLFNSNDRMGGPFVSYTFLDSVSQRVVCVDGFLYAPSEEKRDLLRQVEAILLSAKCLRDSLSDDR